MGRRVSSGTVGGAGLGALSIVSSTIQTGSNTNLTLSPNGTGLVNVTTNLQIANRGDLRLLEATAGGTNYVGFQSPESVTSNVLWTLPASDGTADQVLTTDAAGTLSWSSKSVSIADQTSSSSVYYPLISSSTSSSNATALNVSSTRMTFVPSSGLLTVTALTESSSITLKENIDPIQDALDAIMQLAGVIYDRKDGSRYREVGLIAEDVNKIIPNVVTKDDQGNPQGIQYTKLTAYLVEAVKTLKQEINNLKGI